MDRQIFWMSLLIVAIIGTWLWNHVSPVVSGSLTPLLNFVAGFAVAGAAVLLARRAARLDGGGKGGRK
jgi:hypothetical protein